MFLEIIDISTGTPVQEPLNAYSINYVYSRQEGSKYNLIYVLTNGIRKIEEFNNQSDLNDRIDEIKELSGGGGGGTNVYTYKGSCTFENLPTSGQSVGDVWNITNDFTLGGKSYPAGTNVAWDGTGWDALAGSIDLSNYYTKAETDTKMSDNNFNLVEVVTSSDSPFNISLDTGGKRFIRLVNTYTNRVKRYAVNITMNGTKYNDVFRATVLGGASFGTLIEVYGNYAEAQDGDVLIRYNYFDLEPSSFPAGFQFGCQNKSILVVKDTNETNGYTKLDLKAPIIDLYNSTIRIPMANGAANISAKWTFTVLPESSPVPTTDYQLVNKKYVDDNAGMPKFNYDSADPDSDTIQFISDKISSQEDPGMFNVTTLNILDSDTSTNRDLGFGLILMKYDSTDDDIKCTFYGNGGQATFDLGVETNAETGDLELVMSNYYNLADTIGDINEVLSTLTIPSAVEQALSEI